MNDAVERLKTVFLRRNELSGSSVSTSPTSPRTKGSQLEKQLANCVSSLVISRSTTPISGENTRKTAMFPGPMGSPANSSDSTAKVSSTQNRLGQKLGRNGSVASPTGVKKRRSRASKKPPTKRVDAKIADFRDVVQSLTGGTFCSQATLTASPIVSSALPVEVRRRDAVEVCAPTSKPYAVISVSAPEAYVVRPQPSRPSGNCISEDPGSAQADASPVANAGNGHESLPSILFDSMLSDDNSLNYMMGYTSSWADSSFLNTESVAVSLSMSQYPGVHPSEMIKTPSSACYTPFLKESGHFRESLLPDASKAAGSEDAYFKQLDDDCDVDGWLDS
ncbi:hypothetical protein Mapa_007059 [Marchantia paleacea]|nr:hypothetical protein Mapa_007059 [Marchantia paleacea]